MPSSPCANILNNNKGIQGKGSQAKYTALWISILQAALRAKVALYPELDEKDTFTITMNCLLPSPEGEPSLGAKQPLPPHVPRAISYLLMYYACVMYSFDM